jgi:hypothetical protein
MPRLGTQYEVEVEVVSKPKFEYLTDEYFSLDLPVAPAVMVGEEIVTEGRDIDDHTLETVICRHLSLPEPGRRKGIAGRLFGG